MSKRKCDNCHVTTSNATLLLKMSLLTSRGSLYRKNKKTLTTPGYTSTPEAETPDHESLLERATSIVSSRRSLTHRFRSSVDYRHEEPLNVKFKKEVRRLFDHLACKTRNNQCGTRETI